MNSKFPLRVIAVGLVAASKCAATFISAPAVIGGSAPFSGAYPLTASVDGGVADYASSGAGLDTYLEFDFGSPQIFDRIISVNRDSPAAGDLFSQVTYTFSADPVFDGADELETIAALELRGRGQVQGLSVIRSGRYVRFDVDTLVGGGAINTGAMELMFLQTPTETQVVTGVTVLNAATAFNPDYAPNNAINDVVGSSLDEGGIDYASAGLGSATFLDFDFGVELRLAGFDLIDRFAPVDRSTSFDLILSNDATFSSPLATLSFSKGAGLTYSATFAPQSARYARYDVTGTTADNAGVSEIIFYESTVPEPAGVVLLLLGAGWLRLRVRGNSGR